MFLSQKTVTNFLKSYQLWATLISKLIIFVFHNQQYICMFFNFYIGHLSSELCGIVTRSNSNLLNIEWIMISHIIDSLLYLDSSLILSSQADNNHNPITRQPLIAFFRELRQSDRAACKAVVAFIASINEKRILYEKVILYMRLGLVHYRQ